MANGDGATERRMAAWVGKALLIQGKVTSTENLTIDGRVEGTIDLGDHSLTIGSGASVQADLVAQSIIISGEVAGDVRASVRSISTHRIRDGRYRHPADRDGGRCVVHGKVDVAGRRGSHWQA